MLIGKTSPRATVGGPRWRHPTASRARNIWRRSGHGGSPSPGCGTRHVTSPPARLAPVLDVTAVHAMASRAGAEDSPLGGAASPPGEALQSGDPLEVRSPPLPDAAFWVPPYAVASVATRKSRCSGQSISLLARWLHSPHTRSIFSVPPIAAGIACSSGSPTRRLCLPQHQHLPGRASLNPKTLAHSTRDGFKWGQERISAAKLIPH